MARCIKIKSKVIKQRMGNAEIHIHQEDFKQALKAINKILELDPENADAYSMLGLLEVEQGISSASQHWKKALELDPDNEKIKKLINKYSK